MFNYRRMLQITKSALNSVSNKTLLNPITSKYFSQMAKFNYLDPLNFESLLTEEEKIVNFSLHYFHLFYDI